LKRSGLPDDEGTLRTFSRSRDYFAGSMARAVFTVPSVSKLANRKGSGQVS
jgi:hypothetical protein